MSALPRVSVAVPLFNEEHVLPELLRRISDVVLSDHRVEWVRVTVHKPDAPIEAAFADVALTILQRREDSL